jgi:hypothetical protein
MEKGGDGSEPMVSERDETSARELRKDRRERRRTRSAFIRQSVRERVRRGREARLERVRIPT